jgi:hypothetical protein
MHRGQLVLQRPDALLRRGNTALGRRVPGGGDAAPAAGGEQEGQAQQPDTGQEEHDGVQDGEPCSDGPAAQADHAASMPWKT